MKIPKRLIQLSRQDWVAKVFRSEFDEAVVYMPGMILSPLDTVLFEGGTDVDPAFYNEEPHPFTDSPDTARDSQERLIFRKIQAVGGACIGICRGAQLLTVLSGGKLIQHVEGHRGRHDVKTANWGFFSQVPADHHQSMWPDEIEHDLLGWSEKIGTSFCNYGKAYDVLCEPEIVWIPFTRSLCIQPHPEWCNSINDPFAWLSRQLVKDYIHGPDTE